MKFLCVGAKAAINSSQYRIGMYGKTATAETIQALATDLKSYTAETLAADSEYMIMVAVFSDEIKDEIWHRTR